MKNDKSQLFEIMHHNNTKILYYFNKILRVSSSLSFEKRKPLLNKHQLNTTYKQYYKMLLEQYCIFCVGNHLTFILVILALVVMSYNVHYFHGKVLKIM